MSPRPWYLVTFLLSGVFWTSIAVATDTAFYTGPAATESFRSLYNHLRRAPVITPLNNLLYNTQTSNLAEHGLHPHYQHLFANLPQLLGPALPILISMAWPLTLDNFKSIIRNSRLVSATTGILILSVIPHQEPRFLLPCVPLLLTCIRLPTSERLLTLFWATWVLFNSLLAILMGSYHQTGIVPAQLSLPSLVPQSLNDTHSSAHNVEVFWWKTYPPPTYLLGSPPPSHPKTGKPLNISTVPLMGLAQSELVFMLMQHVPTCDPSLIDYLSIHKQRTEVLVAAPLAAWRLPDNKYPDTSDFSFHVSFSQPKARLGLRQIAQFRRHVNLDDIDLGDDGLWGTLERVVGRRGLGIWRVERICDGRRDAAGEGGEDGMFVMGGDW